MILRRGIEISGGGFKGSYIIAIGVIIGGSGIFIVQERIFHGLLFILIGVGSIALGAAVTWGQSVVLLDPAQGIVVAWWELGVPFNRRICSLRDFDYVGILASSFWYVDALDIPQAVFKVLLLGPGRRKVLAVKRGHPEAVEFARNVADFLNMPVSDTSSS